MTKQKHIGWICRAWTETSHGWTSEFENFATEEEAREHGYKFCQMMNQDELAREFEVYKNFTDPF